METQTPTPSEPVNFDGRIGELYKIFLLNLFLGILTLGIYHFWGKTRARRYITSGFNVANDRLEYTGYGSELLWGFIKALIFLTILAIPFFWFTHTNSAIMDQINQKFEEAKESRKKAEQTREQTNSKGSSTLIVPAKNSQDATPSAQIPEKETTRSIISKRLDNKLSTLTPQEKNVFYSFITISVVYWLFYAVYMPFVAIFSSLKYRVTRTHWRGIRGHMHGSSILYGFVGAFHFILKVVTLGLWIPFGDALVWKYKMKRLSFGNQAAVYTPPYGKLFMSHIGTIFFSVIIPLLVMVGSLVYIFVFEFNPKAVPNPAAMEQLSTQIALNNEVLDNYFKIVIIMGYFLLPIMVLISRFWYRASFTRAKYNGLRFGNIRFNCTITGWRLFRQQFGNFLILLLTLGLGYPIVKIRRQRFFSRHFRIIGDLQSLNVQQASGEKDKWGEGLGSMFDLEVGLF